MIDIPTFITTATAAIGLFDKIADQVRRFIKNDEPQKAPPEHSMKIEKEGNSLVSKRHGVVEKRITGDELKDLPDNMLAHIKTLEKSMQNYYAVWSGTYPQLPLLSDPLQKAKVEAALRQEVLAMKKDLERILNFIEECGFHLDDHYLEIRDALESYN